MRKGVSVLRKLFVLLDLLLVSLGFASCECSPLLDPGECKTLVAKYDVRILRDKWGVPHVFGKRDADTAFGLGYAQAEDDFATLQEVLLASRAELASVKGVEALPFDYLTRLFRVQVLMDQKYESDLSTETKAICEAYADAINLYASLHPEKIVKATVFPATGKDIVAGFVQKVPFFFMLQNTVKELLEPNRKRPVSAKQIAGIEDFLESGAVIGSNGLAVAPKRSEDGFTRLAVNSHQPWTGPVAWYEAHLHSEEGWDVVGGTFPGSPVIFHGHNRNLGWAHTVNFPDLADVFVLEMNPENPNQYRFDGQWLELDRTEVEIDVNLAGPVCFPVKRELLWSVYGPVIRQTHGVYAIRYAGMDSIRQVEQWYRMGKAKDFSQWLDAMRIRAIPSFNVVYADGKGNIGFFYNALFPIRSEGYDWRQYLPGNTSETLWKEYVPFEKLPQVVNPGSGFVISCNNTPFHVTLDPENPKPEDFSKTLGIETLMTNRATRALELFGGDESITRDEFYAYKFDKSYSTNGMCGDLIRQALALPSSEDPLVQEAVEILRKWNMGADFEDTGTAIAVLTFEPIIRATLFGYPVPDMAELLKEKARLLKNTYGRIDVSWKEVNRMRRGSKDVAVSGGPDTLRAIYGHLENGRLIGQDGDSYILLAEWDEQGKVHSRSIHQFGSATLDENSPHFADQMDLFVKCELKPVWMDESEIRANLEREYRPGE